MMFLSQTFNDSKYTGMIFPSSKKIVDLVAKKAKLKEAKVVVELGPGDGDFTGQIISKIGKRTEYFAIELNGGLIDNFSKKFPALKICHDSAENIEQCLLKNGLGGCDRVISSLPWTAFEENFQKKLVKKIYGALEKNGMFVIFSYRQLNTLEKGGRALKRILKKHFKQVTETKINQEISPIFISVCKK